MTIIRKTKSGWVLEVTDTVYGMLQQGGISGREYLIKRATLAKLGIAYDECDPEADLSPQPGGIPWYEYTTVGQMLLQRCRDGQYDKLLKAGCEIQ